MKELSIFIDESGDFGPYSEHSPYYIVTMVFHDQAYPISDEINTLEQKLRYLGLEAHCIHTGPIIRKEENYRFLKIHQRRKIFNTIVAFTRNIPITYKVFSLKKQKGNDVIAVTRDLSRQIGSFVTEQYKMFESFDSVKVYYDNGQIELTRVLTSVFSIMLPNAEFKKVLPRDYKLFQVADLLCTMELLKLKKKNDSLSASDMMLFGSYKYLLKNYLKTLAKKQLTEP